MDPTVCRLCGLTLAPEGGPRCPNCNLCAVAEPGRPAYVRIAAGLAGIYGLTAVVVLLTR